MEQLVGRVQTEHSIKMKLSLLLPLSLWICALTAFADQTVVSYGFDSGPLPTPDDGFYIFENSRGFVEPTTDEKFSGYRSLELQEGAVDGEFVELQGVVSPLERGDVLFHFAFLVRNPEEELNIAIAGPQHFTMRRDGIAFWLKSIKGNLHHHSDSIPKRLFKLNENRWYVADVVLHLEKGSYDLRIVDHSTQKAEVLLENQPNAINAAGSKISKLSFIGDLEDRSTVHYFVDDVELRILSSPINLREGWDSAGNRITEGDNTSDNQNRRHITTASPSSSRKGYFDQFLETRRLEFEQPQCIPVTSFSDFGVTTRQLKGDDKLRAELKQVISAEQAKLVEPKTLSSPIARSAAFWRQGCLVLMGGNPLEARALFERSLIENQNSIISRAALVAAASAAKDRVRAEEHLIALYQPWATDARLPVMIGMISAAWKEYRDVATALQGSAERFADSPGEPQLAKLIVGDNNGFDLLRETFGDKWRGKLDELYIAQGYYYSLLFSARQVEAAQFAEKVASTHQELPPARAIWLERQADALVLSGRTAEAERLFNNLLQSCSDCASIRQKLKTIEGML